MYNPITISHFFVYKYGQTSDITPMKLVKLVYISHGWYLGLTGNALIDENPEAWKYGPVIPSVYHYYKDYGKDPIKRLFTASDPQKELPDDIQIFLDKIWEAYKNYSALDLSTMTHQIGTPWFVSRQQLKQRQLNNSGGFGIFSQQISDNLIRDHYKKKLEIANQNPEPVN